MRLSKIQFFSTVFLISIKQLLISLINIFFVLFAISFPAFVTMKSLISKALISKPILVLALIVTCLFSFNQAQSQTSDTPTGTPSNHFDDLESGRELVNMDFPELTDIKDIIKAVSLWTGKNVILDRNVNGKIQIISPKPVTKIEAYEAFKSALNVLNLTPVETGKFIKIMPIRNALKDNLRTYYGSQYSPNTDQIITQVIPLKFVDAKAVRSMLTKVVSSNSLIAYEPTNTLIVSESGFKINRVLEIIKYLDVETEQSQVAIVPIIYSDAKNISNQVKQIFTGNKSAKGGYHSYKIFPDTKTNSVVIFGPPRTIKEVRNLVKKFDIKVEDLSRQATIHVRPLDYADAKKLAATLNSLTSDKDNKTPRFSTLARLRSSTNRDSNNSSSTNSSPTLTDIGSGVKITAYEPSNSLLITGSRSAYNAINSIIRKMDIKRSQVFIEADILDISLQNNKSLESSLIAGIPSKEFKNIIGWETGKGAGPLALSEALGDKALTQLTQAFQSDFTFGIMSGEGIKIPGVGTISPAAMIKMLKTDSNTRVLSSPHILISNNEPGLFSNGRKLLFESTRYNETTGSQVPSLEREEVKLQLKIKPNISYSDYVTLKIELDADSIAGYSDKTNFPEISKKKTQQTVTIKNGQTVVISGLVDSHDSEQFAKIPLLGDIPILGWLFRNSRMEKVNNNLIIFVTAHIVHGPNDLSKIYNKKISERDEMLSVWSGGIIGSKSNEKFLAMLPNEQDGVFVPTRVDEIEAKKLQELREIIYQDIGYYDNDLDSTTDTPIPARDEIITTVPIPPPSSNSELFEEEDDIDDSIDQKRNDLIMTEPGLDSSNSDNNQDDDSGENNQ